MRDDGADTALARALHAVGAAPLDVLRGWLDEVRAGRERGEEVSLVTVVRARALVPEETLVQALSRSSSGERPHTASGETEPGRPMVSGRQERLPAGRGEDARPFVASWEHETNAGARSGEGHSALGSSGETPGHLGPYRVIRPLAKGGMGAVLEVELNGARHAAKILLPGAGHEERSRLRTEGELLARLDHPHIVRVHSASLAGPDPWLVVDLLPNGSLHERLKTRGPLGSRQSAEIVARLARAVEHAHGRGVLHRDLKPHNVLFDDQDQPRLVDFGVARALDADRMTRTGETMGTPAYMAPEQALDAKSVDGRADVYGLGAILYACLTARPPFNGTSTLQVLQLVCSTDPVPPSSLAREVEPALEALCLRAMARTLEARVQSAGELADALEGWLAVDGAPVGLRKGGVRASHRLPPRRTRWGALAGLALAGGLGAGATALFVGRTPEPEAPAAEPARVVSSREPAPVASASAPWDDAPPWYLALPEADRPPLPLPPALIFGRQAGRYPCARDPTLVLVWVPPPPDRVIHVPAWSNPRNPTDPANAPARDAPCPRGYFIGRTEISWSQAERCLPVPRPGGTPDDLPALHLAFAKAQFICEAFGMRLPTEAEWFHAAYGAGPRKFPWGDGDPSPYHGHFFLAGPVDKNEAGASPYGCLEMLGNAREWVSDPARAWNREAHVSRGASFSQGGDLLREQRWLDVLYDARGPMGVRVACDP
jgi:hypothetical protein